MQYNTATLIAMLTGIPQKKIDPLLEKKTVSDLLIAPGMIPGISQEQLRRMEALNEFSRAYSAAGHAYTLDTDDGQIARYLYGIIGGQRQENLVALLYDKKRELVRAEKVSKGGIAATTLDPNVIGRLVSENNAKYVILAHNHPSGNTGFSEDDIRAMAAARKQLSMIGCSLENSYVIGDNTYCNENTPDEMPIPAARVETVLFPNAQKEQDERTLQDLLSLSTGIRRANIEKLIDKGFSIPEIMCNPQGEGYGLASSEAGMMALAKAIAQKATTNEYKNHEIVNSPDTAAEAASNKNHKAGVLFIDARHCVVEEVELSWPLTNIGCHKIAKGAYKNNVSSYLLYRKGENLPAKIENKDIESADRVLHNLFGLGLELVDVIVLSKEGKSGYKSLRRQIEMPERETPCDGLFEPYKKSETQRRTRR